MRPKKFVVGRVLETEETAWIKALNETEYDTFGSQKIIGETRRL